MHSMWILLPMLLLCLGTPILCRSWGSDPKLTSNGNSKADSSRWPDEEPYDIGRNAGGRFKRKATKEGSLWPDASITYTISEELPGRARRAISEAVDHWEERTCLRFHYMSPEEVKETAVVNNEKYVQFQKGVYCHSSVGKCTERGPQNISVSNGCAYPEMMIHEIGHLIGLWHEQARWDRDNHVIIIEKNIKPMAIHNFDKVEDSRLLTPYDLSSIMHYDMKTFSANGKRTLTPVDEKLDFLIGYRKDLSFYDMKTVNKMYNCLDPCPRKTPVCQNEGFIWPSNCTCSCPRGLRGRRCQKVERGTGCGRVINLVDRAVLKSPRFPKPYRDNSKCVWLIKSPPNTRIAFHVEEIDIEQSKFGSCRDKLEVRYLPLGVERGPVFCGTEFNETLYSSTNRMMVHFTSNSYNMLKSGHKGFRATITVEPKSDCASHPCLNSGTCIEEPAINDYICKCPDGWVGKNCDSPIRDGGFSEWSEWSRCYGKCGLHVRLRSCTNPVPANGGRNCEGETYQTMRCGDQDGCEDAYMCGFGTAKNHSICDMEQDSEDKLDWTVHQGETPSKHTGPVTGHTTGTLGDPYLYLEASYGEDYDNAIVWIPQKENIQFGVYCLQFYYNLFGENVATLSVLQRDLSKSTNNLLWQASGNRGSGWHESHLSLVLYSDSQIGFQGVRGNAFDSDIALDDLSLSPGKCEGDASVFYNDKGCVFRGETLSRGPYIYREKCMLVRCFCNQDGHLDCPNWQRESVCDVEKKKKRKKKYLSEKSKY